MSGQIEAIPGGVTAPRGFKAGTARGGLKKAGDDVALLVCETEGSAAATFTTNPVAAAPVRWSRQVLERGRVRAAVVNSGNANACTGERGLKDAEATARAAARALGLEPDNFLVASTGILGHYLPMEKLLPAVEEAARRLDSSPEAGERFARAIMTTDTVAKQAALRCQLPGGGVALGGATKGAGMIAPRMATTLTFLTTDAAVPRDLLHAMLRRAVERTYNRISVDNHTSTNDTVLCLASGLGEAPAIVEGSEEADAFERALTGLCRGLALQIVADGEGASRLVHIRVVGAPSEEVAVAVGRAIADSPLCKCALHSGDPNWGRFVSAAGMACRELDEARTRLLIGDQVAYAFGQPADTAPEALAEAMSQREITLTLELGLGDAEATVWTCDLSKEYVEINADYHT